MLKTIGRAEKATAEVAITSAVVLFCTLPMVSQAQAVGDFRTSASTNFATATGWQRYDGTAWVAAAAAPTSADGVITIGAAHTASVTTNVTLDQVSVDGILQVNNGRTLTLADGAGDDLFVRNRLFFQATGVIAGAGQLVLGNQAIVQTANVGGLAASITSTNPTLTAGASYWFNGTAAQSTGFTGFTSLGNPLHFSFRNTAGITIDRNLTITGTLTANNNVPITIGAGVTAFTANAIYNGGSFNNCVGATISPAFTNSAWASPKGVYQSPDSSEPTTEASNIWTNSHKTTAHIYWMQSGSGNNRIVVLKAGSAVSPTAAIDNTTYTANAAFGTGTAIDGGFVVYNGAGSQVNVTGLIEGTTYHVAVFEYNQDCGTNRNYKTGSPLTSNFVASERPFITEWITTDGTLTIPTTGGGYNYTVSYRELPAGGVTVLTGQTGNVTLSSLTNGSTYEVSITGTFPRIHFGGSTAVNAAKIRNIKQWGSVQWTSMEQAFGLSPNFGCYNLNSNATDVPNLTNVSSLQEMFFRCFVFNGGNIANWNTQNITTMSNMFAGLTGFSLAFNQPISTWNTSNVTNMQFMFGFATLFNQSIGTWNTANVTDMSGMFLKSAFNQPIGTWNTGNVTEMGAMFTANPVFNQPISTWNTANVTSMIGMFGNLYNSQGSGATAFNQPIGTWNTANVILMRDMFRDATAFNQPLSMWNTDNVTNMSNMFQNATSFNQSLATWNVSNLSGGGAGNGADQMLNNCGINTANYDATLIGWAAQNVKTNVFLGSAGRTYCEGAAARSILACKGWTISGDSQAGGCTTPSVGRGTASLNAFSACAGVASVAQSYFVTGNNLTGDIVITPPSADFEVSQTSATAGFAPTQTLTQSGGVVACKTIWIRQTATAVNGAGGNITLTSAGVTTQNVLIPTSVVSGCPTISSFSPISGGVDQLVTITGTNFLGATAVMIGGVAARSFTVVSANTITAFTNDGFATGVITVTQGGVATSASNFTRVNCGHSIGGLTVANERHSGGFAGIRLNWTNGDNLPDFNKRVLVVFKPANIPFWTARFLSNTATTFLINHVEAGIVYEFYVQSLCGGTALGDRLFGSTTFTPTIGGNMTCPTPTGLTVGFQNVGTQANLTWNAQPNAVMYQVHYQQTPNLQGLTGTGGQQRYVVGTSHSFTGLTFGAYYRFRVKTFCMADATLGTPFGAWVVQQAASSGASPADSPLTPEGGIAPQPPTGGVDVISSNSLPFGEGWGGATLFPNPTADQVTVALTLPSGDGGLSAGAVVVMDLLGRVVVQPVEFENQTTLNVKHLAKGCYVVRITTEQGEVVSRKLVVE